MRAADDAGSRLPVAPELAEAIEALGGAGYWATAYDTQWRILAETTEEAAVSSGLVSDTFHFGPDAVDLGSPTDGTVDQTREAVRRMGGWMLVDLGVDRDGLREMLHPALRDVVDDLEPSAATATAWMTAGVYLGDKIGVSQTVLRVRDANGEVVGTLFIVKPRVA